MNHINAEPINHNKLFKSIYKYEREDKQGGNFEIFEIKHGKNKDKSEYLRKWVKKENLLFTREQRFGFSDDVQEEVCPDAPDFENNLLPECIPESQDFVDKKYLIKEKNLIIFANKEQEKILDTDDVEQFINEMANISLDVAPSQHKNKGELVMENSYGRMAMAYLRAKARYPTLLNSYKDCFKFTLIEAEESKLITLLMDKADTEHAFDEFYKVVLKKNEETKNLSLKKCFELLQVFNSNTKGDNYVNGNIPALVGLKIGQVVAMFVLSPWPYNDNQVLVSMRVGKTRKFNGNAYSSFIDAICRHFPKKDDQAKLANDILDCLNAPVFAQPNNLRVWKDSLPEDVKNGVIELLATTQIAEASHGTDPNKSRTPGTNKLARKVLGRIATGNTTFRGGLSEIINDNIQVGFPPIGKGGTDRMREAIRKVSKMVLNAMI
jgi:hypothetical protein